MEPIVVVNFRDGLRAANGHPQPYGVKYFQIGNETWAYANKASDDQYMVALEAYVDATLIAPADATAAGQTADSAPAGPWNSARLDWTARCVWAWSCTTRP